MGTEMKPGPREPHVLLALPAGDGCVDIRAAIAASVRASDKTLVSLKYEAGSCLPAVFNRLWCHALENVGKPYTHFAMLHSDLEAEPNFVETLLGEQRRTGAVVVSAAAAIKDGKGVTSTAVGLSEDEYDYRRITVSELAKLPETFGLADIAQSGIWPAEFTEGKRLLVNTGCWITRLDWPGWHKQDADGYLEFCFEQRCRIQRWPDGHLCSEFSPEDWRMARYVARNGGLVVATKKVGTVHYGRMGYTSKGRWGAPTDVEVDQFLAHKRQAFAKAVPIEDESGSLIGASLAPEPTEAREAA